MPGGVAALFSCSAGEVSYETDKRPDGKGGYHKGHGMFFHYVLEGLKGNAKDKMGQVELLSLVKYIKDEVPVAVEKEYGRRAFQTPELRGEISNMVLVPPGREVIDKAWPREIENSIKMKLVRIKPGKFKMGSPAEEKDRSTDEEQHDVEITKEFWLGIHEVTQGEFKAVMDYNPSYFSKAGEGKPGDKYEYSQPAGGKEKVPADTSDFPMENVSYAEAVEFCKKLTAKEKGSGRLYRLPTEAEWEYACRGGVTSYQVFNPFGNSLSFKDANFDWRYPYGDGDKKEQDSKSTCKVGSYRVNDFGLFDMHGNVWEWCSDWYDKDYYGKSPPTNPPGPLAEGSDRVFRGGGWYDDGRSCRSASRDWNSPSFRRHLLGLRAALVSSS